MQAKAWRYIYKARTRKNKLTPATDAPTKTLFEIGNLSHITALKLNFFGN